MHGGNELRERLAAEEPVFGVRSKTCSPVSIEVFGNIGFDFVWVDLEHFGPGPTDSHGIESLARAATVAGTELLVRIPEPNPAVVRKVLDTGVRTVLVSRVESADETRRVVRASKFEYDGESGTRGSASARAKSWGLDGEEYYEREDETTLVGVMIETEAGASAAEAITAVPELGFVFLGPGDLAISLGRPGESSSTAVSERLADVRETAIDADVPVGCVANDADSAAAAVADGVTVLRVADEIGDLTPVLRGKLEELQDLADE